MAFDAECRKAFEEWFREGVGDAEIRLQVSQRYPDQYTESTVDAMWDGWQGAWNSRSTPSAAEPVEGLMKLADEMAQWDGERHGFGKKHYEAAREALRTALVAALAARAVKGEPT